MKAIILEGVNQPLKYTDCEMPEILPHEVLIKVKSGALNHRDLWIQRGQYGGLRFPSIQGSDGCGVVEKVGANVDASWLGKEVIINPSLNWGDNPKTQVKEYMILGMAQDGTFAEYVKIDARLIHHKPSHLTPDEAAAFPLAGITAYRSLFKRARAVKGETVLITGVGGGVALFVMLFAIAAGCDVYVTSGSEEKLKRAISLGAKGGVNYKSENWDKELKLMSGGFDAIVDSSGGDTFAKLVDMAKPAGRIAMYGATLGAFNSGVPAKIFWKQLDILGSTMGNDSEFAEMVQFINEHKIKPVISSIDKLADAQLAYDKMAKGEQFGKIVLRIS